MANGKTVTVNGQPVTLALENAQLTDVAMNPLQSLLHTLSDPNIAFILFTLYMIPDPATTPINAWRQALFGFSVAAVYGILQVLHIVFGLFFALVIVCAIRGVEYRDPCRPAQ